VYINIHYSREALIFKPIRTKICIMYAILEEAFTPYPMRKKVADLLLRQGLRVDAEAVVYCGQIEISPAKVARALGIDRRVVIETAQMIAGNRELLEIFSGLYPTAFIRGIARTLGFEVLEIEADPHAVGIVSTATNIIASAKISIRQVVADDPDIFPNPRLCIIIEKKLPGHVLSKLREMKGIRRITIE
jgi:uncharacterized protein